VITETEEVPVLVDVITETEWVPVRVITARWCCSQGCSGDERLMGKSLADIISRREKLVIAEGQEPDLFWVSLGGKTQYANSKRYPTHRGPMHGRGTIGRQEGTPIHMMTH
jgi:hypothetical protein